MIFSALIAKFLSAGAVAQAATGATVAVVAFTGVGAVGALPDPVQDTFATVVAEITPLEVPTSEEVVPQVTVAEDVEETEGTTETEETTEVVEDAAATAAFVQEWVGGPKAGQSFTDWVHEGNQSARVKEYLRANGMTFGNVVSSQANGRGLSDAQLAALGITIDQTDDVVVEEPADDTVVEDDDEVQTSVADSGSNGNGNGKPAGGNGNGRGNGKN